MRKYKRKFIKVLALFPWILFAGFSVYFFQSGSDPVFIFSIFLPILLLIFGCHEAFLESSALPWALGVCAVLFSFAILCPARKSMLEAFMMAAQWVLVCGALSMAGLFFNRNHKRILDAKEKISEVSETLKTQGKGALFYREKIASLTSQIGERRRLSSYAREMGTLLDPNLIRQTLIEKTKKLFTAEKVSLRTVLAEDPVDSWVGSRKSSMLVKNADQDKRLSETAVPRAASSPKSTIATPLLVGRKLMGLIRADSPSPNRFSEADLQELEVYAYLATLALENAQLFSEVNAMATKDGLTGLATHRIFQERLSEELLRGARYHTPISLVMADIDRFKSVNDRHGHLAGDEALKEFSAILSSRCRPVDFAARYGGEEFCLILPGLGLNEARGLAEAIRGELEARPIFAGGRNIHVTASFGCASFPDDAQAASQLIRKADERLYRAKSSGRNRVVTES